MNQHSKDDLSLCEVTEIKNKQESENDATDRYEIHR